MRDADDAVADNVSQGKWSGVNLSLCALNLGNVAGHTLPTDKLAEMYALLAMTVRLYLPAACHFLVVSYFAVDDLFRFRFICRPVSDSRFWSFCTMFGLAKPENL